MEIRAHFLRHLERHPSLSAAWENPETLVVTCAGIAFGLAFSMPALLRLSSIGTYDDWDLHSELHWVSAFDNAAWPTLIFRFGPPSVLSLGHFLD
jgi:hypothetical protein